MAEEQTFKKHRRHRKKSKNNVEYNKIISNNDEDKALLCSFFPPLAMFAVHSL